MNIAKWISNLFLHRRPSDKAFVQLWINDLGPRAHDVIQFIADEQDVETDGLRDVYGHAPSLYLELYNGDDLVFLINSMADELELRGAIVDIRFANESETGL